MTAISIRQSGGANIISIPKAIVKTLGLHVGSKLDMSIKNNKIVLTPTDENLNLETLLANSPKYCFKLTDKDIEWTNEETTGDEI